jgi:Flp pilus assembly protein TadG
MRALTDERGSTAIPMVLLTFLLLSAGGLGFDLYRLVVARQTVVGIVDSAAIAGATAVDEDMYFNSQGTVVVLDPAVARQRATASISSQPTPLASVSISVAPGGEEITVAGAVELQFTLIRLLLPTQGTARVPASATSAPRVSVE